MHPGEGSGGPAASGPQPQLPAAPARWPHLLCLGLSALPALGLLLGAWRGTLGANPLADLLHESGRWALNFWCLSLGLGPARQLLMATARLLRAPLGKRLADWNPLLRLRRQWGLWAWAYASLHLGLYVLLDAGLEAAVLWDELRTHRYLQVGLLSYGVLLLLAASSNAPAMRLLGAGWRRLHQGSYLAAAAAVLHLWLQIKPGQTPPWWDVAGVGALCAWRLWAAWQGQWTGSTAVPERARVVKP